MFSFRCTIASLMPFQVLGASFPVEETQCQLWAVSGSPLMVLGLPLSVLSVILSMISGSLPILDAIFPISGTPSFRHMLSFSPLIGGSNLQGIMDPTINLNCES